jgi:hypothetical protein
MWLTKVYPTCLSTRQVYWFSKLFDMVSICLTLLWLDMVLFQNFLFSLHWNVIDKDDEVIGSQVNMDCLSTLVMCHIHLSWILMKVLENCEQSIICTRRPIHSFWSRFMKLNHPIDKDGLVELEHTNEHTTPNFLQTFLLYHNQTQIVQTPNCQTTSM